jgi:hypothetical protein
MNLKSLIIILFVSALISCKTADRKQVVLQLGRYQLTAAQLKLKIFNNQYKLLSKQAMEEKLIEEGRILAFAIEHRYDTISSLNMLLNYASRAYVSREDGFVWNKKVKPRLQLTEKDLHEAYNKRFQEYTFEIIRLSGTSAREKYHKWRNNFDLLRKNAIGDKNATVFTVKLKFPYDPLGKYVEISDSIKPGDVLQGAETETGFIYSSVKSVKPILQQTYETEKTSINKELVFALTQKYIWQNQKQLFVKTRPEYYDGAINDLVSNFDAAKKSWPGINPNLRLMEYTVSGKRLRYLAADFKEFVDNEPVFMGSLANPLDVKKMLQSIIITQYLFAEAKQMNVETDEDYVQFRKNYQENIFIEHFRRNYVFPKNLTPDTELEDYYRKHSTDFKSFESAKVAVYKFKDNNSALRGQMMLSRHLPLLSKSFFMNLKITDFTYDPKLVTAILKLNQSQISSPIAVNGEFLVLVMLAKEGLTTLPFIYAKEAVKQIVYALKEKQLNSELQKELNIRYPIEENKLAVYLPDEKDQKL